MQIQKDEVRDRIVDSAKQEFLENGIEKASMRKISISHTGNISITIPLLKEFFKVLV